MHRNGFQSSVRWALAVACLGALTSGAQAASMARECATRDLQVLMMIEMIEARESARNVQEAADALGALMHARIICHEGRAGEALAIYDSIAQDMVANSMHPDWRR